MSQAEHTSRITDEPSAHTEPRSTATEHATMADQRAGKWHIPMTEEISQQISTNLDKVHAYNQLAPSEREARTALLKEILNPASGECVVQQPFMVEYGINTTIGQGSFLNFGATILDTAEVRIGERVLIGPNCQLITVGHPVDSVEMRAAWWEIAKPITIEQDVWLGAGVTVLPGVTIGEGAVVGSGAVVSRDIPPRTLALGVPAKVVRALDEQRAQEELAQLGDVPLHPQQG
ncbi:sugar O-acetyltransferase [Corynebacterium sp. 153RC1]|uniref:sugar O-acetyltransferase n=1 Tax=unclassified Corynebacterium TaxID=2624378 RepID=UPI00211BA397|nr:MULTISPECIES: sugar O-acetyltransferase [unclassified Corynebacterium]MCQ9352831.1 sugar O-acetyltransferase [Corynebacterium sp. 209RC1]MCQ9355223.1 sugar O-acetyltransferase [Corynebacterium sp. 1222RC1]MCQ9357410.1 sugar O-acetyltransferase [Corynebacterium sp. 122RC1]MCQ9359662.1 sugar O-acetyltransferase [Corynebacterium sp. 142RC1]MCQ9361676.1 sugar O-acetyltransferase [Corynebacterium sp. 153RC1]